MEKPAVQPVPIPAAPPAKRKGRGKGKSVEERNSQLLDLTIHDWLANKGKPIIDANGDFVIDEATGQPKRRPLSAADVGAIVKRVNQYGKVAPKPLSIEDQFRLRFRGRIPQQEQGAEDEAG